MTTIKVRSYERPKPERKPDPLLTMIEARRAVLLKKEMEMERLANEVVSAAHHVPWWRRLLGRIWGK